MTYIQREVGSATNVLVRVPVTPKVSQPGVNQPVVKKKPGLTYMVIEKGVVVSKTR